MSTQTAQAAEEPHSRNTHLRLLALVRRWWRTSVTRGADRSAVIEKLQAESVISGRYLFMASMSAGIAVLGLLLSSPAVVIGAMLIAPFMEPLLGAGFALAVWDFHWLRRCIRVLLVGILVSFLFCAFVVFVSPIQTITEEIAARTRPSLFDLLVALFAALAGAYAIIRGRGGTIVGVAIATALMPPLAAAGFGFATWNLTIFAGASFLLLTNVVTIALSGAIMARYYGFSSNLAAHQTRLQSLGIVAIFLILSIPLGISLSQIAWESNASGVISSTIKEQFGDKARVSRVDIDFQAEPVQVSATVLTPEFQPQAELESERELREKLGRPLLVTIEQFQVSANPGAAEAAQLARARAAEQAAAAQQQVEQLTQGLALIAGVDPKDVTIDRQNRRALVEAEAVEGTTLAGYRALEQRISASVPDWNVQLRPPLRALPNVWFRNGKLTPEGHKALALIAWAAERADIAVGLSGPERQVTRTAELLRARDIEVVLEEVQEAEELADNKEEAAFGPVETRWVASLE